MKKNLLLAGKKWRIEPIKFVNLLYVSVIFVAVLVIAVTNMTPGTWLSGWDTLHPEFDFALYFKRIFFGAWQEHQGVGAPPAQAHSSELPRLLVYWLLSFIFQANNLRYVFFFLTLFVGCLGFYYFCLTVLVKNKKNTLSYTVAFISSLVYLFNITVIQLYFVPLEMFALHFALLPWVCLYLFRYIHSGRHIVLLYFAISAFFLGSAAHTPTLFIVTIAVIAFSLFVWNIASGKAVNVNRSLVAFVFLLLVNLYWIIPSAYFIKNHSSDVLNSSIHENFSQEAILQGRSFGTVHDLILQKNFLFNWYVYDFENSQYKELLGEWKMHYDQLGVRIIAYSVFAVAVLGGVVSLVNKRKIAFFILPIFLISILSLANDTPMISSLYEWAVSRNNLIKEALRFPFTKLATIYLFSLSSLFALGLLFLTNGIRSLSNHLKIALLGTLLLVFMSFPLFEGNLISPAMRVRIPQEYFEMFAWFKSDAENLRVAKLPIYTMWGWGHYEWGYQGAGFTWFGLPQPTLDREFDRWSPFNESFYNEAQRALVQDKHEPGAFEKVLAKYDVFYLLLDKSLTDANNNNIELFRTDFAGILERSDNIKLVKEFGDRLAVYETGVGGYEVLKTPDRYTLKYADMVYEKDDFLFDFAGVYINSGRFAYFPFANLDPRKSPDFLLTGDYYEFEHESVDEPYGFLNIPLYEMLENVVVAEVSFTTDAGSGVANIKALTPEILLDDQIVYDKSISIDPSIISLQSVPGYVRFGDRLFVTDPQTLISNNTYKTILDLKRSNYFETYQAVSIANDDLTGMIKEGAVRYCSDPFATVERISGDDIRFEVGKEHLCVGGEFELLTASVLSIAFDYESSLGSDPYVCISERDEEDSCIGWDNNLFIKNNDNSGKVEYLYVLQPGLYWLDLAGRSEGDERHIFTIKNLNIESYELTGREEVLIDTEIIADVENVTVANGSSVKVRLPFYVQEADVVRNFSNLSRSSNCSFEEVGFVSKTLGVNGITYFATDSGVSCDFFEYKKPRHDTGSIVKIKAENLQGRNIKIYLSNHASKRIEIEKILDPDSSENMFYIHPTAGGGRGYTLNVETRAFGRIVGENTLSGVEFIYLPINWLRRISVGEEKTVESSAEILDVENHLSGIYKAEMELGNGGEGLLTLSQGYDEGWRGYRINSNLKTYNSKLSQSFAWQEKLITFMPWFFGEELEHVMVNGWSNGWIIESAESKVQSTESDSSNLLDQFAGVSSNPEEITVVIIFWPQILQFLGYTILVTAFLMLVGLSLKVRQKWYFDIVDEEK